MMGALSCSGPPSSLPRLREEGPRFARPRALGRPHFRAVCAGPGEGAVLLLRDIAFIPPDAGRLGVRPAALRDLAASRRQVHSGATLVGEPTPDRTHDERKIRARRPHFGAPSRPWPHRHLEHRGVALQGRGQGSDLAIDAKHRGAACCRPALPPVAPRKGVAQLRPEGSAHGQAKRASRGTWWSLRVQQLLHAQRLQRPTLASTPNASARVSEKYISPAVKGSQPPSLRQPCVEEAHVLLSDRGHPCH